MTGGGTHPLYASIGSLIIGNLLAAGLIIKDKAAFTITNQGFQFLLADSTEQLATLMVQYCLGLDESELFEVLTLLALLTFLQTGHQYAVSKLSKVQQKHLGIFETYGLVYFPPKAKGKLFVPSRLVHLLGFSGDSPLSLTKDEGFLVVETNYKVYAYTGTRI